VITTILLLFAGHALCDYPLQGDFLARAKNHRTQPCSCGKTVTRIKGSPIEAWGNGPEVCKDNHWHQGIVLMPWWQALLAHSLIHSGMVLLITHNLWFALAELVIHCATDYAKCNGNIDFQEDQFVHYSCKLLWAIF
jgi:hypothetical protein